MSPFCSRAEKSQQRMFVAARFRPGPSPEASRTYASVKQTMALPPTVRVKLSSEAAESISLTPVVVQELPVRELVEHMLGVTGKDEARIRELLLRGTLVSGASRFRWAGWEADLDGLARAAGHLSRSRPVATLRRRSAAFARSSAAAARPSRFTREAGARKGLFQRETFWDVLMERDRAAARRLRRIFLPRPRRPVPPRVHRCRSRSALRAAQRRWCAISTLARPESRIPGRLSPRPSCSQRGSTSAESLLVRQLARYLRRDFRTSSASAGRPG